MSALTPGAHRIADLVDDTALVAAMVRVETAWVRARRRTGELTEDEAERLVTAIEQAEVDPVEIAARSEQAGNPVVPLVADLRSDLDDAELARQVHRGLTSQDVLDTGLILLARDALRHVRSDLHSTITTLAGLAEHHRTDVMVGRTLTQVAVPITFGLTAAQWLTAVIDAAEDVDRAIQGLPVQCGGAAGTLALAAETGVPTTTRAAFATELGLACPPLPWHTRRRPITTLGDTLLGVCDAVGVIASDVAVLGRPEIAEVREGAAPGRGGSSTMPHKRNPVLALLIRSAAMQAPALGMQLHTAAGLSVDQRPDGAWHSEWEPLRRLLAVTTIAASQAAELVAHLDVDVERMAARAHDATDELLAERGRPGHPGDYLGATHDFVDAALARVPEGLR